MTTKSFTDGLQTPIKGLVETLNGASYLSWATAVALAGRPSLTVRTWGGTPALRMFGGAVVAVEAENGQLTWLPVLDARNRPVPSPTARDVSDSVNRCRAKAVAMVHGVGLCLYSGEQDPAGWIKKLGVKPGDDLAKVPAITSTKGGSAGAAYVDWATALAAAKIADPDFRWSIVEHEVPDANGVIHVMPAMPIAVGGAGGYMVAVSVTYRGREHVEWLPIMGIAEVQTPRGPRKMDHQTLLKPDVFDWNKAVMRCLAKAIAVASGYGISTYAGEDIEALRRASAQGTQDQAASQVGSDYYVDPAAAAAAESGSGQSQVPDAQAAAPADAPAAPADAPVASAAPADAPVAPADAPAAPVAPAPAVRAEAARPADDVEAVLQMQLKRLQTISDPERIRKAISQAERIFGARAPEFISECEKRLRDLEVNSF
jgi:hypothetical protein